jgi:hypothetical protein
MSDPRSKLPHLEGRWLISVRKFLRFIHGSIELSDPQIQPLQRQRDLYLMDLAMASTLLPAEIKRINLCRLYFNVNTLSDVTNASGTRLLPGILDGTILISQPRSRGPKVKQPSPDNTAWAAWRKLLRLLSNLHGNLHVNRKLGPWTCTGTELCKSWPFLYSPVHT